MTYDRTIAIGTAIVLLLIALGLLAQGISAWIPLGGVLAMLIIALFLKE